MAQQTQTELERLEAEFEKQNETLDALFTKCGSLSGEGTVEKAVLEALDEICRVQTARPSQPPTFGTRC